MKVKLRFAAGFTLVELVITLVIAGILSAVAVPSMRDLLRNQHVVAHANMLIGDLHYARSEAGKSGAPVTLCKQDGASGTPACDADVADSWVSGWVTFVDCDSDGVIDATCDRVLRVRGALEGSGDSRPLICGQGSAADTANRVTFRSTGDATLSLERALFICDQRGDSYSRAIGISSTGRVVRRTTGTGTSCAAALSSGCPAS